MEERRVGAIIVVASPERGIFPVIFPINEVFQPDNDFSDKRIKHAAYALTKYMANYLGGWGSRVNSNKSEGDPTKLFIGENPIPAGSFINNGWFISVSGFSPAIIDEAVAIGLHVRSRLMLPTDANKVAAIIDNEEVLLRSAMYFGLGKEI